MDDLIRRQDFTEVIRCKDCKHWRQQVGAKNMGLGTCSFHNAKYVTSEGYCYWAERRTDDGLNQPTGCD